MMRAMFAAISGLRVHQTMLDVTANDIANVNTVGYKAERTTFKDALSQLQRGASGPTTGQGGTNPVQIGLGVQLGGIGNVMSGGAIQSTGNPLDLAVQGDGFFRVGGVQWSGGAWTTSGTVGYTRAGNFSLDQTGNLVTQDGDYVMAYKVDPLTGGYLTAGGAVATGPATAGTSGIHIPPGNAKNVSIGADGMATYVDMSTGVLTYAGKVALASFPNASGLERISGNKFGASSNSGAETLFAAGSLNAPASLAAGSVEMSNVDLAQEFTNMITAQRGFQANSRVITAADEMLQQLVNLGH
jgi:flagellar hook protein FlgE